MVSLSKPVFATVVLSSMLLGLMLGFASVSETPGVATEQALRGSANNEEASKKTLERGQLAQELEEIVAPAQQQRMMLELPPTDLTAEVDEHVADEVAEVPAEELVADEVVEDRELVDDENEEVVNEDKAIVNEDEVIVNEDRDLVINEDEAIVNEDEEIVGEQEAIIDEENQNILFTWPEQAAETNGFWGPDDQERAQLAQFVAQGTWEQLDEDDESFSFAFDT